MAQVFNGISIYYHVNGRRYAYRRNYFVPRVDEKVVFKDGLYEVTNVIWHEDGEHEQSVHVSLRLVRHTTHDVLASGK